MRCLVPRKYGIAGKATAISKIFCNAAFVVGLGLCVSNNAYSLQVFDPMTVVGNRIAPPATLPTQIVHGYRSVDPISPARRSPVGLPGPVPELGDEAMSFVEVAIPISPSSSDPAPNCSSLKSNPIDYSTGNKIEPEIDFSGGSYEMPLQLVRSYNHHSARSGVFGLAWISSFDERAIYDNYDHIYLGRPGGGGKMFLWDGDSIYYDSETHAPYPGLQWVEYIKKNSNGTYTYYDVNQGTELYNSAGQILEIMNENGVKWVFTYLAGKLQRVTHTSGRYVQLNWQNGLLSSVVDPAGNIYSYTYAARPYGQQQLLTATLPGVPSTVLTYHYQGDYNLVGKSFNGNRYSYFEYSPEGLATASYHAGLVDKSMFAYEWNANGWITKTTETTPLGQQIVHNFENGKEVSTSVQQTTYCTGGVAQRTYDTRGALTSTIDFNGNITKYTYSDYGQLLEKIEAFGTPLARRTVNVWDINSSKMLRSTVIGLVQVDYVYGLKNRIASVSVTNLSQHGVAGQVRTTTYAYTEHANGMVASVVIDGPLSGAGDAVAYIYSSQGDLLTEQNSLGHTVQYSNYNGLGQPGRVVGANGETTDYSYDARSRVTKVRVYINGGYADTDYSYNGEGLLAAVTTADGVTTSYTYDAARRLVSEKRDVAGTLASGAVYEEKRYQYDVASNVTAVRVYADNVLKASTFTDYDEQGRVRGKRGNNGQNVRYTYDPNGNLKTVTDSANQVSTQAYDALDRLASSTDPLNGVTRFEYDLGDQATKMTDPRNLSTTYTYDGFGQVWSLNSPDTGNTWYGYDAAGQRTGMTRNDGSWLGYAYDGLGRLYWSGTSSEARWYSYDWCNAGKGRLCGVSTADTQQQLTSTIYGYTPEGRIYTKRDIASPNGTHDWTGFSYDNMGRLTGISYPSGVVVGYGYSSGKLTLMNTTTANGVSHDVVHTIRYQPYGPAVSWTYGNGLARNFYYDQNANAGDIRLTGLTTMDGGTTLQSLLMAYNANNQITSITNFVNQGYSQSYSYDALSRLAGMASPSGNESIQYDATGNRTMHNWLAAIANEVDPASNRIIRDYAAGGDGIIYTHDGRGNRASQSWNGSAASYAYDAYNRLKSVSRTASTTYYNNSYTSMTLPAGTTTYMTNALDQRVAKSNAATSARYVYSGQNTLLAENNNSQWTSHLWLGGQPIGLIRGNAMHWTHTDHLNRPELVTNTIKQVVWRAKNFHSERGVIADSIGGYNLGLPGQYFDAETGLWYNGFRYYDSRLGRYTQSDPIGLAGGTNTYAYVRGNPANAIDPLGLRDIFVAVWHAEGGSPGHVFVGEIDGSRVLLSQFPNPHGIFGDNMTYSWAATLNAEGRMPDSMYRVHIKDDGKFDAMVQNLRDRPKWSAIPSTANQTHCAYAAYTALAAGGVNISVPGPGRAVLPNQFDADLIGSMLIANHGVRPIETIPWGP